MPPYRAVQNYNTISISCSPGGMDQVGSPWHEKASPSYTISLANIASNASHISCTGHITQLGTTDVLFCCCSRRRRRWLRLHVTCVLKWKCATYNWREINNTSARDIRWLRETRLHCWGIWNGIGWVEVRWGEDKAPAHQLLKVKERESEWSLDRL